MMHRPLRALGTLFISAFAITASHSAHAIDPGYMYVTGAISLDDGAPKYWEGYKVACRSVNYKSSESSITDGGLWGMKIRWERDELVTCELRKEKEKIAAFVFISLEFDEHGNRTVYMGHRPRYNTTGLNLGVGEMDFKNKRVWIDEYYVTETTADPLK